MFLKEISDLEKLKIVLSLYPINYNTSIFFDTTVFLLFFIIFYLFFSFFFFSFIGNFNFSFKNVYIFSNFFTKHIDKNIDLSSFAFRQSLFVLFFLLFYLCYFFYIDGYLSGDLNIFFEFYLYSFLVNFFLIICFCMILYFWFFFFKGKYKIDIFFLLWIVLFSLVLLLISRNLIILYLSLEILAICSYALISAQYNSILSVEAALKYLILAAISSASFLLGIFFFYFFIGSFDIYDLFIFFTSENIFHFSSFIIIGFFLIFVGLFFKIGLAPFHFWMPDVYSGSALPITAFFAILPKVIYLVVFLKFLIILNQFCFFSFDFFFFEYFFLVIASLSLFVGTLSALNQVKIKRFLAYSAISHMSYVLFCLIFLSSVENIIFVFFYLFSYMFLSLCIFSTLIIFYNIKIFNNILSLSPRFSILNEQWFIIFIIWISFFLSIGGIPPFLGFFSKFFVLKIVLNSPYFFVAFFISFFSVISLFYYLKFIIFSFFLVTISKKNNMSLWFLFESKFDALLFLIVYGFFFNTFIFLDLDNVLRLLTFVLEFNNNFDFSQIHDY